MAGRVKKDSLFEEKWKEKNNVIRSVKQNRLTR